MKTINDRFADACERTNPDSERYEIHVLRLLEFADNQIEARQLRAIATAYLNLERVF